MAVKLTPSHIAWFTLIIYAVGCFGFLFPATKPYMPQLIWVNLVFTLIMVMLGHKKWSKEFVLAALESAELEPDIDRYVRFDEQFVRPAEVDLLIGDPTKAKNILGWEATTTFQQLVDLMVQNDLRILVNGNYT
jgi:hypothetical protein